MIVSEMAFMDSVETVCEACGGLRYSPEALQYRIRGEYNIAQVMDMTVRAASRYFAGTVIEEKLRPLMDVGLVYLHLNQALSTLSGGELQRMKLASRLGQSRRIFILDRRLAHRARSLRRRLRRRAALQRGTLRSDVRAALRHAAVSVVAAVIACCR